MPTQLRESTSLLEAAAGGTSGRLLRARLIEGDRWGSSGYYAAEVLRRDGPTAWPEGTHVYLDHPSESEMFDRPERSVRDLAGQIASTPIYENDGLYADVEVFEDFAPFISARHGAIGMSIRAAATVEQGEAAGRTGTIITGITEGLSVDFVTHAGAGGAIVQVLESAVAHGVSEATANDTRDALQTALRDAHPGERVYVWVRDFDDTNVWFELETPDGSGTYQVSYTLAADGTASLGSDQVEVTVRTQYVPVLPAGQSTTQESEEDTMPHDETTQSRQLEEATGRVQALEAERNTAVAERDQARRELAEARARDTARPIAARLLGESTILPATTQARVVEAVLAGVQVGENGFDEAAFTTAVEAARTQAETELTEALEAHGVGKVRNTGQATETGPVSEADLDAISEATFGPITQEA